MVTATVSTTVNTDAPLPCSNSVAAMVKAVAMMPDSMFIRTGVPSRDENFPK